MPAQEPSISKVVIALNELDSIAFGQADFIRAARDEVIYTTAKLASTLQPNPSVAKARLAPMTLLDSTALHVSTALPVCNRLYVRTTSNREPACADAFTLFLEDIVLSTPAPGVARSQARSNRRVSAIRSQLLHDSIHRRSRSLAVRHNKLQEQSRARYLGGW